MCGPGGGVMTSQRASAGFRRGQVNLNSAGAYVQMCGGRLEVIIGLKERLGSST